MPSRKKPAASRSKAAQPKRKAAKTAKVAKPAARPSAPKPKSAVRPVAPRLKVAPPPKPIVVEPARPVDSGLTAKDIEQFEQMLLEKRAQLRGDVETLHNDALGNNRQEAAGNLSSMPIHMADLGTDNYEQEFTLGLIEGERAVLREIEEALERIRQGTFGVCLGTGQPIGKARLRARPWAKYCYEYTLQQERGRTRRM